MIRFGFRRPAVLLVATMLLLALPATADAWTFTSLPDPAPPYVAWGTPALNGAGEVVFLTWLQDDTQAIVALGPAGPRLIARADGAPFASFTGAGGMQLDNQPDLDDGGRVVFRAYTVDLETWEYTGAAYRDDHGARTALTSEAGGAGPWLDWCNPALSGDGTCALVTWDTAWQTQTLWGGSLPGLSALLDNSGSVREISTDLACGDGGRVLVHTYDADFDERLLLCGGGAPTLISARVRDGIYNYHADRSVNAHGQVAFHAQTGEWTEAILVGDGGPLTTVVQSGETDFFSFHSPGIDDQGRVAFQARLMDWRDAILTGPDPVADVVVAEQDSLFGSVLSGLELGPRGVNAAGDIAFRYWLDDGREGIAIARRAGGAGAPLPAAAALALRCAPNPFNPSTRLVFTLPTEAPVRLTVHDAAGRLVAVLRDGVRGAAGRNEVAWRGCDDAGRALPSGVYVARLEAAGALATARVTLLR